MTCRLLVESPSGDPAFEVIFLIILDMADLNCWQPAPVSFVLLAFTELPSSQNNDLPPADSPRKDNIAHQLV